MRTVLSLFVVSFVFMSFQLNPEQVKDTEKHPFEQVFKTFTSTIQQELQDADAIELLWTVNWEEMTPSESFNMLRDKGVYTEEIFTQSGNVAKYYMSYTAKTNSTGERKNWLKKHTALTLNLDISESESAEKLKNSLKINRIPESAKSPTTRECKNVVEYKENQLAEEFVTSMDESKLNNQSFQDRGFQKHVLQYAMQSIALEAYASVCK